MIELGALSPFWGRFGTLVPRSFSVIFSRRSFGNWCPKVPHAPSHLTSREFAPTVDRVLYDSPQGHGGSAHGALALGAHLGGSSQDATSHNALTDIDCHTSRRPCERSWVSDGLRLVRRLKTQPRAATVSGTVVFEGGAA